MQLTDDLYKAIEQAFGGYSLIAFILTAAIIIVCTILVAALVTKGLKKLLTRNGSPLPAMSIYLNIARIIVWVIGISCLCSTCFSVDVSGIIAAMGVTGIAISLGLKDTISNLISGVQISGMKLLEPGDHVMVANMNGIVRDTTWRHTEIEKLDGDVVIVPNSMINSSAIVQRAPFRFIRVHVELHAKSKALTAVSNEIADVVREAVEPFGEIDGAVQIKFSSVSDKGAKGAIRLTMKDDIDRITTLSIKDAIVRAIAPYAEAAKE